MPSGKTHEKVNFLFLHILIFTTVLGITFYHYGVSGTTYPFVFILGYWFGTYYLSPDLDLKSSVYYRWKWTRIIWHPYQRKFAHRSFWTHGILIGDLIRVFYISLLLFIPIFIFAVMNTGLINTIIYITDMLPLYGTYIAVGFCGICLASTIHIISDFFVSFTKKMRKQRHKTSK